MSHHRSTGATVSIVVSGPSKALAAVGRWFTRARTALTPVLRTVARLARRLVHLPRVVADVTLAVLSTESGYTAAVTIAGKAARATSRTALAGIRAAGSVAAFLAHRATGLVDVISPTIGGRVHDGINRLQRTGTRFLDATGARGAEVASLVGLLVRTPLVRAATSRVAAIAGGLLALHLITEGAILTRVLDALPHLARAVAWTTNPWALLATVGVTFLGAIGFAALRLRRANRPGPEPTDLDPDSTPPAPDAPAKVSPAVQVEEDFAAIVAQLQVVIQPDGSVRVDGIPADLPPDTQQHLAHVAAQAAVDRMSRVARSGRRPTPQDRRTITRAARTAALHWLNGGTLQAA